MSDRPHWSNRLGFILAATGSAIGLGNIWKFPYIAGTNGGGAFVLIYLACILIVGIPILLAEMHIGRESQSNAVKAFQVLHKPNSAFRYIGFAGVFCAFVILSFYSVVGGWVLDFELRSIMNEFGSSSPEEIKGFLGSLFANPWRMVIGHTIFMVLTISIVLCGVAKGIEKWNKILMPVLLLILAALLVRSFFLDGFGQAFSFLFSPNFSNLTWEGILEAVGHSFFTLSLGMGVMITYGSYLPKEKGILKTAIMVAGLDTLIALVAGLVIFSVVFTFGQEAGAGPTLMFVTLPMLFKQLPGGYIVSVLFFLLVAFAALTSSISLLEVVVAYWDESRGTSRVKTSIGAGIIMWAIGILCALSFNVLSGYKLFGKFTFFDTLDKLSSSILLPLGGLVIAIFFGWTLGKKALNKALEAEGGLVYQGILWSVRVISPIAIAYILYKGIHDIIVG
jgi:NSS family neurotransmitter:Na+ symporter